MEQLEAEVGFECPVCRLDSGGGGPFRSDWAVACHIAGKIHGGDRLHRSWIGHVLPNLNWKERGHSQLAEALMWPLRNSKKVEFRTTAPAGEEGASSTASPQRRMPLPEGTGIDVAELKRLIEVELAEQAPRKADREASRKIEFENRNFHPEIVDACCDLFVQGHFKPALFTGCIRLNRLVQERASRADLDGVSLFSTVFSPNAPVLKLNEMNSETDRAEQRGLMHLFQGVWLAIRDPLAHSESVDPDEILTLEYLSLLSSLARRLDGVNIGKQRA